jgi:hypothetical protein
VGPADADVVQAAVDAQCRAAVGVDAVGAHSSVAVETLPGSDFGACGVGLPCGRRERGWNAASTVEGCRRLVLPAQAATWT